MLNNKFVNKHKKQAQQVIELALAMPIFIILFCYTFQLMVETFSKYKFSYVFSSAVRNAIQSQTVFKEMSEIEDYNIARLINNIATNVIIREKIPYTDVKTELIDTPQMTFLQGAFKFENSKIFVRDGGKSYFYFTIPINKVYTKPVVLNKTTHDIDSYFNWYYTVFANVFYEGGEEAQGDGTGGGDDEGAEEGDEGDESSEESGDTGGDDDDTGAGGSGGLPGALGGD